MKLECMLACCGQSEALVIRATLASIEFYGVDSIPPSLEHARVGPSTFCFWSWQTRSKSLGDTKGRGQCSASCRGGAGPGSLLGAGAGACQRTPSLA